MKSRDFAMSAFLQEIETEFSLNTCCNSVYSDKTFRFSVLFHACHVNHGLESLKNYASLSLIALATAKTQTSLF